MTKAQRAKWNREVVYWWMGFSEAFVVQEISDSHFRLTRLRDALQMDYHPDTSKAVWLGFDEMNWFTIKDMESYIQKMFL